MVRTVITYQRPKYHVSKRHRAMQMAAAAAEKFQWHGVFRERLNEYDVLTASV